MFTGPSYRRPSPRPLSGNAVIGQSGGPTAVINQSLVGVVEALRVARWGNVKRIYGMRHGVNGLVKDQLVDLARTPKAVLSAVAWTPSAALGSSRDKPDRDYCNAILNACARHKVRFFFYIGGNDSADTCRIVSELAAQAGYDMRCIHIPKTVDNDLMGSDHAPGFPSAARFVATAFMADNLDNASLPGIKINVVMGRHAGFLAAASALARGGGPRPGRKPKVRKRRAGDEPGPHLIYLPEVPFDADRFIGEVERVYARIGRCQIAVSEGVQDKDGRPIVAALVENLARDAHGNIQLSGVSALGDGLAELVKRRIRTTSGRQPRVRADTFGYLQRCWPDPAIIDTREAYAVGRLGARFGVRPPADEMSGSVAILRASSRPYRARYAMIPIGDVAARTRHMPPEFIADGGKTSDVTRAFVEYCRPLVGTLPRLTTL